PRLMGIAAYQLRLHGIAGRRPAGRCRIDDSDIARGHGRGSAWWIGHGSSQPIQPTEMDLPMRCIVGAILPRGAVFSIGRIHCGRTSRPHAVRALTNGSTQIALGSVGCPVDLESSAMDPSDGTVDAMINGDRP